MCRALQQRIGSLFTCSRHGEYQRIRTPFLYPDGDNIDLFCKAEGDDLIISDLAETTGWLRMQSAGTRRTQRQERLIEYACMTHGIDFHRGMLRARCGPGDELAQVIARVGQAALRVSDMVFTIRPGTVRPFKDKVAEFLTEHDFGFDRPAKVDGDSGHAWTVDFRVRSEQRTSLVQVLSAASRSSARRVPEHVLAGWFDLQRLAGEPERLGFVSLFDDTSSVWKEKDYRLVKPLSKVVRWSRPNEFAATLGKAA